MKRESDGLISQEAREWLPIESAPKDGTHVILLTADYGAVEGWWDATVAHHSKSRRGYPSYDPTNMFGDWVSNWDESGDIRLYCGATPEFWMPLPNPPVSPQSPDSN